MKIIDECIICKSSKVKKLGTKVSGFLAERIWNKEPFDIFLCYCPNCDFYFYNLRLNNEETQKLYENYRGEEYQKQRNKHEFYYTKQLNASIGNNKQEIEERKKKLFNILNTNTNISKINSILDYGGDKGQFIIDGSSKKYVYEISGIETIKDVIKINNFNDCKNYKYDLIMCSHVLEHLSEPGYVIDEIKELMSQDTILYFELPCYDAINFNLASKSLLSLIFSKNYMLLIKKILKGKSLFYMHEHINFFTPQALNKLLALKNLEIIYIEPKIWDQKANTIRCLAKAKA